MPHSDAKQGDNHDRKIRPGCGSRPNCEFLSSVSADDYTSDDVTFDAFDADTFATINADSVAHFTIRDHSQHNHSWHDDHARHVDYARHDDDAR